MQNDPDPAREPALPAESGPGQRPSAAEAVPEVGGPAGPEPTRFGDWEKGGRCIDF